LAETVYEGMFLLDPSRYARDPEGVAGQIPRIIEEAGGTMLVSRFWEERRLAYPIRGNRKGTYWLTYFRVDGQKLAAINRECQLSDSILRVLFLKVDPRTVDVMVEHAQPRQSKPAAETATQRPPGDAEDLTDEEAATAGKSVDDESTAAEVGE
jgi:small subunit ribosomal protein S6